MNPNYWQPSLGNFFRQGPVDRKSRSGKQIAGTLIGGVLWLFHGLGSAVRRSVGWISLWCQRRVAILELRALNDHYLRDIGLDRSQIVSPIEEIRETGGQPPVLSVHEMRWRR